MIRWSLLNRSIKAEICFKKNPAKRIEGQFFPGIIVFQNRSEEIVKCNMQETE